MHSNVWMIYHCLKLVTFTKLLKKLTEENNTREIFQHHKSINKICNHTQGVFEIWHTKEISYYFLSTQLLHLQGLPEKVTPFCCIFLKIVYAYFLSTDQGKGFRGLTINWSNTLKFLRVHLFWLCKIERWRMVVIGNTEGSTKNCFPLAFIKWRIMVVL